MELQTQTAFVSNAIPTSISSCHRAPAQQTRPALKKDDRWSDFDEVLNLLHYDGEISDDDNNSLYWRRRVKAGQSVLRMGQPYEGLYVVRFGALKTVMTQADGTENVLAFPMKGNLVGFDGICKAKYLTDVIALTDCDLIKLPETALFSPGQQGGSDLERVAYWAISREMANEQAGASASRSVKSEVRVARFLRIQSDRFAAMGYSPRRFTLPMTRRDIGSHLNVTLESVSRAFSAMNDLGIISINRRDIEILSFDALQRFENQGRLSS